MFDFGGSHLAEVIVVKVAVNAAFVAAVGDVQMNAEGHSQGESLVIHVRHEAHCAAPEASALMGWSDTRSIPCCESSRTNCSASVRAVSGSISNSAQTLFSIMRESGVWPSAACQMAVATSFRVKKVESVTDMIIISPPSMRAAMRVLFAMYFSLMGSA